MDELTIEGKTYISSKKAAKITGYAKDYVGQLCREGRVEAKLVGRSWYVYEPSLNEHRFNDERKNKAAEAATNEIGEVAKNEEVVEKAEEDKESSPSEKTNVQATWEHSIYRPEPLELLPELAPEPLTSALPTIEKEEEAEAAPVLSEMQSAWQDWFSNAGEKNQPMDATEERTTPITPSIREIEAPRAVSQQETVQVRPIVSDIMPSRSTAEPIVYRNKPVQRRSPAPRGTKANLTVALTIAFILVCISITLVATGLFDVFHVGGVEETPIIQFFQGSQVIEK